MFNVHNVTLNAKYCTVSPLSLETMDKQTVLGLVAEIILLQTANEKQKNEWELLKKGWKAHTVRHSAAWVAAVEYRLVTEILWRFESELSLVSVRFPRVVPGPLSQM